MLMAVREAMVLGLKLPPTIVRAGKGSVVSAPSVAALKFCATTSRDERSRLDNAAIDERPKVAPTTLSSGIDNVVSDGMVDGRQLDVVTVKAGKLREVSHAKVVGCKLPTKPCKSVNSMDVRR